MPGKWGQYMIVLLMLLNRICKKAACFSISYPLSKKNYFKKKASNSYLKGIRKAENSLDAGKGFHDKET